MDSNTLTTQEATTMKIQINEVWNGGSDGSKELAVINVVGNNPKQSVYDWISANRPDLDLCTSIYAHGFHAKQIA